MSDLQLIVAINAVLVVLLALSRFVLWELEPARPDNLFWESLYAVLVITFGQDFPDGAAAFGEQARLASAVCFQAME